MTTDPVEEVLDRLEQGEEGWPALYADLQNQITMGMAELAQARLTSPDLHNELKICNFRGDKAHLRVIWTEKGGVELVGAAPKTGDVFGTPAGNPYLYRARGKFVEAVNTACKVAAGKKKVMDAAKKLE